MSWENKDRQPPYPETADREGPESQPEDDFRFNLDTPPTDYETLKETQSLTDEGQVRPLDLVDHESLSTTVHESLALLTDRERAILEMRYDFHDTPRLTLEEVGKRFGLTRERIRQIEAKALKKLRHPSDHPKLRQV